MSDLFEKHAVFTTIPAGIPKESEQFEDFMLMYYPPDKLLEVLRPGEYKWICRIASDETSVWAISGICLIDTRFLYKFKHSEMARGMMGTEFEEMQFCGGVLVLDDNERLSLSKRHGESIRYPVHDTTLLDYLFNQALAISEHTGVLVLKEEYLETWNNEHGRLRR